MTENIIRVPKIVSLEGEEFYADTVAKALAACRAPTKEAPEGHDALFMPEFIDTRIFSGGEDRVWQTWFLTQSIRATMRRQGTPVVAYVHKPNHFSDPKNIARAVQEGLRNGAGILPKDESQRILDSEDGNRVHVIELAKLMSWPPGIYGIDEPTKEHMKEYSGKIGCVDMLAINHPQTIPFIGQESRARQYLGRHKVVFGPVIRIVYSNDLQEDDVAVARPLYAGVNFYYGLNGGGRLLNNGRFLGVRCGAGEASASQNFPSEKKLADIIGEYVAPINQAELTKRVHAFFQ
jgi:hypothetical protein